MIMAKESFGRKRKREAPSRSECRQTVGRDPEKWVKCDTDREGRLQWEK